MSPAPSPPAPRPAGARASRVLLGALTAAIALAGVALFVLVLEPHRAAPWWPPGLPWWTLAPAFLLAEIATVRIEALGRRRISYTFSFTELPLVIGLLFASPAHLVAGEFAGALVALALVRRQTGLRLLFNLAQFVLTTCVAAAILHTGLDAFGTEPAQQVWLLVAAGVLAGNILGTLLVTLAVAANQRAWPSGWRPGEIVDIGTAVVVTTTFFAIACAELARARATALALLLPAAGVLVIAYKAYVRDRRRQERTELLYGWMQRVQAAADIRAAVRALLEEARWLFRADLVEILLLPGDEGDTALRSTGGPGDEMEIMVPVDPSVAAAGGESRVRMRAALQADDRTVGRVTVSRAADAEPFDAGDRALLDTYVSHAGLALENGRLQRSLVDMASTSERLALQAVTDPLTGLANRSLLMERLAAALAVPGGTPVGVLLVDLDGFKAVNDTHGHAAGDRVLVAVAQRLRGCMRTGDTAGRLGGDEFLAVLEGVSGIAEAQAIAGRLELAMLEPVNLGGGTVTVGGSIGIAVGRPGEIDADALVARADGEMYVRKAQSGGRGRR
ncbi:MAG: GGDEF domain-containing protein [Thermoleophilia bacterium]